MKVKKRKKRWLALLLGVLCFIVAVLGVLELGAHVEGKKWKRWYADYERVEITSLLEKQTLSETEYALLYRQTGLTKLAVDDMRTSAAGRERILEVQEAFFRKYTVKSKRFAPFTYMDTVEPANAFCTLRDGDIILSAVTHVSWFRFGHAWLVVDGEAELLAESEGPGNKSELNALSVCKRLADFLVFRPKAPDEVKAQIVEYVQREALGVPYHFTVGILSKKAPEKLKKTHCSHFVWYAYNKFGYDLDSNGGGLVTGRDMARSDKMELVQAFGFDLDKLWS